MAGGGFSDEVSFEHDLHEVKKPGSQRPRGKMLQAEGTEYTSVSRPEEVPKELKGVPQGDISFPIMVTSQVIFFLYFFSPV